jgi:CBS domain containing-hemolysin-like protein
MILDILLTTFLVILNGFFVAAEFALVKIRSSQLEVDASNGNRYAKLSLNIVNQLESYLSGCQL